MIKYLLIDFDGTVRETISCPSVTNPNDRRPPFKKEEVKIINGIPSKLKFWRSRGWQIVGVSNQSGVEKGLISKEEVKEIADHTMYLMDIFFPFYFAPYKRTGSVDQLSLRKPKLGMFRQIVKDIGPIDISKSFMVGDYISDQKFAENIGIKYIDVKDFLKKDIEFLREYYG
jgi:histidinol-phosphate phosphatase family protein